MAAVPTNLSAILLGVQAQLQTLLPPTCVFMSLNPEAALVYNPSDMFIAITPGYIKVDEPVRIGGGRVDFLFNGEFSLTLWTRLALDQVPREDSFLTDPNWGILQLMEKVINLLELYQPPAGTGNVLLAKGFELLEIQPGHREEAGVGFGFIKLLYSIMYLEALNPQN